MTHQTLANLDGEILISKISDFDIIMMNLQLDCTEKGPMIMSKNFL